MAYPLKIRGREVVRCGRWQTALFEEIRTRLGFQGLFNPYSEGFMRRDCRFEVL